ncbi:MAG: hypothetical protein RLN70_12300, partial [Rhodospirillaceae bacterium]
MAELKTKETGESVAKFLGGVENEARRKDAKAVKAIMDRVSGYKAKMWGPSIVGYGRYEYRYDSGRKGAFFL